MDSELLGEVANGPVCTCTILKITEKILLKLLKIDKLTHKKGYTVRLTHGVSLFLCRRIHEAKCFSNNSFL